MTVYNVFWSDSFDDWKLEKVFYTEAKAEKYIEKKKGNRWIEEREVE